MMALRTTDTGRRAVRPRDRTAATLFKSTRAAVATFCAKHNLNSVTISEPWLIQEPWPITRPSAGDWPNARAQGIYLIFGDGQRLLYIGKANGWSVRISDRLARVRRRDSRQRSKWFPEARYLMTIGVDDAVSYMVPSFECFLIWKLHPTYNILTPLAFDADG
jgi:hypothetical protein